MKFTKIPADVFTKLQLNAGVLLDAFNPSTGEIGNIIGATSGGVSFEATPSYEDFGDDIDNCPKNAKELKMLTMWEAKMSGSFVSVDINIAKSLVAACDINDIAIIPRGKLTSSDFADIWWVGDYSDKNGVDNGGFLAIHLINGLSTGGFKIASSNKSKSTFSFEYTGHYSLANQDTVPFEIYLKAGEPEASGDYYMGVTSAEGASAGKTNITTSITRTASQKYVYQTGYNLVLPSAGNVLDGTAWVLTATLTGIDATTGMEIVVAIIDEESKKAVHCGKTYVVAKGATA